LLNGNVGSGSTVPVDEADVSESWLKYSSVGSDDGAGVAPDRIERSFILVGSKGS